MSCPCWRTTIQDHASLLRAIFQSAFYFGITGYKLLANNMNSNTCEIYIAPANPAGRQLMQKLKSKGLNIVGLMDNIKVGDGILSPSQPTRAFKVIVANGGFQLNVAEDLINNGLSIKQIKIASKQEDISQYSRSFTRLLLAKLTTIFVLSIKLLRLIPYRHSRVYYAQSFVDANILVLYAKDLQRNKNAVLIVDKPNAASSDLNAISIKRQPLLAFFSMLFARSFIIDHEYQSLLFSTLRGSVPVVQLWHGLPYKHLSGNSHYPNINDACFISSSSWFNESVFRKIFNSKQFSSIGYPRNDVFFQHKSQRCWLNSEPLSTLEKTIKNTGPIIIYAPTYRDSLDNNYPLNLIEINAWCQQHDYSFILKYHPFIYRVITENMGIAATTQLMTLPRLSHVYIYPNGKNVYPWLAEAAMLITDYSSIAFDFMLAEKPILYYQFDKEEYQKIRGKPLITDDIFINGAVVTTFDDLLPAMTHALHRAEKPQEKHNKLIMNDQHQACSAAILSIVSKIEQQR